MCRLAATSTKDTLLTPQNPLGLVAVTATCSATFGTKAMSAGT